MKRRILLALGLAALLYELDLLWRAIGSIEGDVEILAADVSSLVDVAESDDGSLAERVSNIDGRVATLELRAPIR